MAWYWGLILFLAGLSGGLLIRIFRINRLLSSLSTAGGSSGPPANKKAVREEVIKELEKDNARAELINKIRKVLERGEE